MAVQQIVAQTPEDTASAIGQDRSGAGITLMFTLTAFLGAGLLFVVQPMIAKLLLPGYGGSATVWSTSSLFFQVLLLAAYWYAHASTSRLGRRWQPRLHIPLLVLPALALPVALPASATPPQEASPALWLLRTLVLMIGLPFAVVATTGPLLQRWYSWTGRARSEDPYFLFAASNLGSFGGLLAYPLVIEPNVSLAGQRALWTWGFGIFAVLCAASALLATTGSRDQIADGSRPRHVRARLERAQILRWTLLAFLPSSLMLGVTAHLSTDVAAIPLLWVVPLAIYLATFVIAFAKGSRRAPVWATRTALAVGLVSVLSWTWAAAMPTALLVAMNLALLATVAFAAHARLAAERPAPEQLTAYFLVISFGGALGGLLNGVVAPVLFDRVLEYPLALLAVPLLMMGLPQERTWLATHARSNRVRGAVVLLLMVLVALGLFALLVVRPGSLSILVLVLAAALVVGFWFSPLPVGVLVVSLALYAIPVLAGDSETVTRARSFYGSYEVITRDGAHVLKHGTTVHGSQFNDVARKETPTTYYSPDGPLGDVFGLLDGDRWARVGVVGLGAGTIAAYGRPGQSMSFFEIDQGIVDIARDPRLFSYLEDSDADIETVVGDGRLRLEEYPSSSFDVLVLDAFSSDSIPVHLLTREAMEMYADRLGGDGVLVVHVSNRVFDLVPVLASTNSQLGWEAVIGRGGALGDGGTLSHWIVLSPDREVTSRLLARPGWDPLDDSRQVTWTDDYSSVLSVLR